MESAQLTGTALGERARRVAPPCRRIQDSALRRLLAVGDAVAVVIAVVVGAVFEPSHFGQRVVWGLLAIPLMLFLFKLYGLYDRDVKRISHSTVDDLPWLLHATLIGILVLWLFARYTEMPNLDFQEIVRFGITLVLASVTIRAGLRAEAGRLIGRERAVLVGGGTMALALVAKLAFHPEYRIDVIGSLGVERAGGESIPSVLEELGSVEDLADVARLRGISRVILAVQDLDEQELQPLIRRCRTLALKVSVLPRLSDVLGSAVEIDDVQGITVLGLNPPWLPRSSRAIKRLTDIVIALVLLIVFSPLLLLLAPAIKLDSPGPVFFGQERVGKAGRRFRLFKFRTMVRDAEAMRAELLAQSVDPNWLHLEDDPRITRVGRRMRRLSLDELPQLWNVLLGQMSMVGPRPLIPLEDERVLGWARERLDLTPGITGYWQVLGRTRIPFEEMVKLDYLYVMNWSLWQDVRLILRTLPVVLGGRGAN